MNTKLKRFLEFLFVAIVTAVILVTSPFNPWVSNAFTQVQSQILDIAHAVREGYLAYVELDGHYGPVVYEFYGLGYLLTETHVIHFIMEAVFIFFTVLFLYKTAKLYTSPVFAAVAASGLTIFEWGALTHAGAEEMMVFFLTLTCYHLAKQLKLGFLSHHSYLLAIDFGLVCFLQTGYAVFWLLLIVFLGIKFKIDGLEGKAYRLYWKSIFQGIITVFVPLGIYLWYFKNSSAFFEKVVVYNLTNMGSFAAGFKVVCGTPWVLFLAVLIVVLIVKIIKDEEVTDLCCWLGVTIVGLFVIALQNENLDSYVELSKVFYIVPFAALLSLLDKPFGFEVEDMNYNNK